MHVPLQARTTRRASAQVVALTLTCSALSGPFGQRDGAASAGRAAASVVTTRSATIKFHALGRVRVVAVGDRDAAAPRTLIGRP